MTIYSNSDIRGLWIANGGNPQYATIAAAIAQAESGGNSAALNNNPHTGDYSVGLWQINYFGSLSASRTAAYGTAAALLINPNAQARAAISISSNGTNWKFWSTYTSRAYLGFLNTPSGPLEAGPFANIGSLSTLGENPGAAFNLDLNISDFLVNGTAITADVQDAIKGGLVKRAISHASTVTLQIADPQRTLLNSGIFTFGYQMQVAGLQFSLVQTTKTSDTIQVVFESSGIAALRRQTGVIATSNTNNITSFIQSLVNGVPGLKFVGYGGPAYSDAQSSQPVSIGRGSTSDPTEDSWTCIQRVATSAGWRCFESNNVVYLGPDSFFQKAPSSGTLQEFSQAIQNMDFDYDIGKPFGTVTVTGMLDLWTFNPGQVVFTQGMGPLDGKPWIIQSMQRDLFNPQMTAVLYAPQPQQYAIAAPSYAPF
jgi:hypothetical protein